MKMFVNSYAVISRTHCEVKNTNAKQHIQYTTFVLEKRESKKAYILLVFTFKKKHTHTGSVNQQTMRLITTKCGRN